MPRIWLIAGPTASGKSALALRLARAIGGEIINADSMQLYAELSVLTARPGPADEAAVPHHLFGVAPGAEAWSAGRWLTAALAALEAVRGSGRTAIFVGGTGLYFKVLTEGLAEMPPVPAAHRAESHALFEALGEAEFRRALAAVDPASEGRILPGDRQRLTRAWEVFLATGRPFSQWRTPAPPPLAPGSWRAVVATPPVQDLRRRCDERLEAMVAAGALEEARKLGELRLPAGAPVLKAVGLRPLLAHVRGEIDLAAALAAAQRETRRYAKRQATWFRHQAPAWPRIDAAEPEGQWEALERLAGPR